MNIETSSSCILCNKKEFSKLLEYNNYCVTSDNKVIKANFSLLQCNSCLHIQKQIDNNYKDKIEQIYNNYSSYYLTSGQEEIKGESSRSCLILEHIKDLITLKNGKILDMGTGSGVFLQEFNRNYKWELHAQDIKNNLNQNILDLQNFKQFYSLDDKIPMNYFDIISGIHLFEHILEPNIFLQNIKKYLKKDGFLLLQVPNIYENTFDIFTYDHISHFYQASLQNILKRFFKYIYFPKQQLKRELTVIVSDILITQKDSLYHTISVDYAKKLKSILSQLDNLKSKDIAIFGTSPNALFCASYLNLDIKYFLDENIDKIGKKLYNKEIKHPKDIDSGIKVLLPYSKDLFDKISIKYPHLDTKQLI